MFSLKNARILPEFKLNFKNKILTIFEIAKFWQKIEIAELCKGVHCVDLGESFQTHFFLQNFVSIQPRTSLVKFARSSDEDRVPVLFLLEPAHAAHLGSLRLRIVFCFLKKLSEVRKLTTFYFAKNDHRWVTFISLKTIKFGDSQSGWFNAFIHSPPY